MITLEEFKNQVKDFARPNRFKVEITTPVGQLPEKCKFCCKGAKIPNYEIGNIELKYLGHKVKIGGDYNHGNLVLTFLNDYDFECRKFFEKWLFFEANKEGNNARPEEYLANSVVKVFQLGRRGEILRTYTFWHCVIIDISEIDLSMDSESQIEEFSVTIEYSYWEAS